MYVGLVASPPRRRRRQRLGLGRRGRSGRRAVPAPPDGARGASALAVTVGRRVRPPTARPCPATCRGGPELDDAASPHGDAGVRRPAFTSPTRSSPKWKTLAASTASAPASTAGAKCSTAPAPPLATSGTSTTARTAAISSRSKPALVPSASIELSRISPAPSRAACAAQAIASSPAACRPPCVVTSNPLGWSAAAPCVDGQHQHLRAEPPRDLRDHVGPLDRRGVHADLVRTRAQQPVDVLRGAHPAADGERDEHLLGGPTHHVVRRLAGAGGRGDVEEGQLVGALRRRTPGPSRPGRPRRAGR